MREETFENILRCIVLPMGELLNDKRTYRVTKDDFEQINKQYRKELESFDKFLVLTSDGKTIVGGVLFYGSCDIQEIIFKEFRGHRFMSSIHKNGILVNELYPDQRITIVKSAIESFNDFEMKHHLASCIGLRISNLEEIYEYLSFLGNNDKNIEFTEIQKYDENSFIRKFS